VSQGFGIEPDGTTTAIARIDESGGMAGKRKLRAAASPGRRPCDVALLGETSPLRPWLGPEPRAPVDFAIVPNLAAGDLVLGWEMDRFGMEPPLMPGPLLVAAAQAVAARSGTRSV